MRSLFWIGLVVLVLGLVALGYAGHRTTLAKQESPDSTRITVDVALVVLHATVTDRQGALVSGLGEQDFAVSEDGVPQRIRIFRSEDVPVTVGLVVDHSTTMRPKLEEVSAAVRTFVRSSNREDRMFVVNFNERVSLALPGRMRFTDSTAELENAIMAAPTGGQTALYDAIARALRELQVVSCDRKVVIVISDGGDNASAHNPVQVMNLAGQSNAVIYTVGIFDESDPERNPGVLKRLAQATGGEAFLPAELSEVVGICERIARDIRHQYTIAYVPTNAAHDGSYRSVHVAARAAGRGRLAVRTRTGYIAAGQSRFDDEGAR